MNFSLIVSFWSGVELFTCYMLRRHGACFFHKRLLGFKGQDGLGGHAVFRLVPGSISGIAVICEVDDIIKVRSVSFSGQAVLVPRRLDPINHLDWGAAWQGDTQRGMW